MEVEQPVLPAPERHHRGGAQAHGASEAGVLPAPRTNRRSSQPVAPRLRRRASIATSDALDTELPPGPSRHQIGSRTARLN